MARTTCDVFTVITDPKRRAMLTLLQHGDQSLQTLATALDLKRPQVTAHLQILRAADLVAIRKTGKARVYSLQLAGLNPLYDWLQHCMVAHMGD